MLQAATMYAVLFKFSFGFAALLFNIAKFSHIEHKQHQLFVQHLRLACADLRQQRRNKTEREKQKLYSFSSLHNTLRKAVKMLVCVYVCMYLSQLVFSILLNKQKAITSSLTHIQLILALYVPIVCLLIHCECGRMEISDLGQG